MGRAEQELNERLASFRGGARRRAAARVSPARNVARDLFTLACGCLLAAACTDGADRFTTHAPQIESRVEGDVDVHYGWADDATLLTLAPYHAAVGRNAYTKARLDEVLGPGHLYASLSVWRFGGEGTLALGGDGIPVVAHAASGSVTSIPPSKWPDASRDRTAHALLSSLGGAASLPSLAAGQAVQVLVVFASNEPFPSLNDVRVTLGARTIGLARAKATAVAWDEFRSQPARERFEVAVGLTPAAKATDGKATDGEREADH